MDLSIDSLFLVDAYNLMYKLGGLDHLLDGDPGAARTLLYREFGKVCRFPLSALRIVVDGARLPNEEVPDNLKVIWVASPEKADDRILRILMREARRTTGHRNLVLVSDDRRLRERFSGRGGALMSTSEFIRLSGLGTAGRRDAGSASDRPDGLPGPGDAKAAGVRIRKRGGAMKRRELAWWLDQFDAEADPESRDETEAGEKSGDAATGVSGDATSGADTSANGKRASKTASGSAPSGNRSSGRASTGKVDADYARLMGVDPDDPRILHHEEDEDPEDEDG